MLRRVSIIMVVVLLLSYSGVCLAKQPDSAEKREELSNYSEAECIAFLSGQGLTIEDEALYPLAYYIFKEVLKDPLFSLGASEPTAHEISLAICNIVNNYLQVAISTLPVHGLRTGLIYSTTLYPWNGDYSNYNCYAFALGFDQSAGFLRPGYKNGASYSSANMPQCHILANHVVNDLHQLGFSCVTKTTSCPSVSGLGSLQALICMRRGYYIGATTMHDFHFMKYDKVSSTWQHKPDTSIPLQYNGYPWSYSYWTNEKVDDSGYHAETIHYNETIYYFAYSPNHVNGNLVPYSYSQHVRVCQQCGDILYYANHTLAYDSQGNHYCTGCGYIVEEGK